MTIGALRTRATKLGYRFASAEDGGWIGSLIRDVGPWQIVLAFSGTYPGQDMSESAAVQRLSVQKGGRDVDLTTVPPVLLAVAYGDYRSRSEHRRSSRAWHGSNRWARP